MKLKSLDPRVNRFELDADAPMQDQTLNKLEHFCTYEVFHQKKKGTHHSHVGIVHAPSDDLALVFAKEQYGRRGQSSNIWVVRSENIVAMDYHDSDVFDTTPEKMYRDPAGYKVLDKINKFLEEQKETNNG